jgi:uncharacterized protein (TIGR03435 family)
VRPASAGSGPILVNALSQFIPDIDRMVVDRTGLTGAFDVDLHWAPASTAAAPSSRSEYPSLFAALEEQLGVKVERTSGPVDVLLIDHVEQLKPN